MLPVPRQLVDPQQLRQACSGNDKPIPALRKACDRAQAWLHAEFRNDRDIEELIQLRAAFVDELLGSIWDNIDWGDGGISLAAVGGYGRGELHPHSDIDLLILVDGDPASYQTPIEQFIALLWDIKLDIGHSTSITQRVMTQL